MNFTDIANGESVFLDANTFVYHFGPDPLFGMAASALIHRVEIREITGLTSTHVITEMAHRLMTLEAVTKFGWPFKGIAGRLQRHPNEIIVLDAYRQAVDSVLKSKVHVLTISSHQTLAGAEISQQFGLLSNDAMIVTLMQANGITNIASNDEDFDRVPGLKRFAPA